MNQHQHFSCFIIMFAQGRCEVYTWMNGSIFRQSHDVISILYTYSYALRRVLAISNTSFHCSSSVSILQTYNLYIMYIWLSSNRISGFITYVGIHQIFLQFQGYYVILAKLWCMCSQECSGYLHNLCPLHIYVHTHVVPYSCVRIILDKSSLIEYIHQPVRNPHSLAVYSVMMTILHVTHVYTDLHTCI